MRKHTATAKKYTYVMLHSATTNTAAPDFAKFKPDLETGLKKLLLTDSLITLKSQKEAIDKCIDDSDIITCTYTITYTNGMMLNAKITCTITFTDHYKKELLSISSSKMTGAVVSADAYLKLFAKLMSGGVVGRFK